MPPRWRTADGRRYPFCDVAFIDGSLPLSVRLTAFNPLVPLNVSDSGIPAVLLRYRVKNVSGVPLDTLVCGSMPNFYGFQGFDCFDNYRTVPGAYNRAVREQGHCGIGMLGEGEPAGSLREAAGRAMTPKRTQNCCPPVQGRLAGRDHRFLEGASSRGKTARRRARGRARQSRIGPEGLTVGSVGVRKQLAPGRGGFSFSFSAGTCPTAFTAGLPGTRRAAPLAKRLRRALFGRWCRPGRTCLIHLPRLEADSRSFAEALYTSTLPASVIHVRRFTPCRCCAATPASLRRTAPFTAGRAATSRMAAATAPARTCGTYGPDRRLPVPGAGACSVAGQRVF